MASKSSEDTDTVVIGGMVLDIHASPSITPSPTTTVPGKIQYALGGVARNIAECLSKLGAKPYMISAVGNDMAGKLLLEYWSSAALSVEGIRKHLKIRTAVISNIFDTHGEVVAGVADVEAVERFLTPEWIRQSTLNVSSASVYLVDANLNTTALEASCQVAAENNIPVWFEPVSVAKSARIASVASNVTFVSPNENELIAMANALSGRQIFSPLNNDTIKRCSKESFLQNLKPAIMVLLENGIKIVVVTLGAHGLLLCSKDPNFTRIRSKQTMGYRYNSSLYNSVASACPSPKFSNALTEGNSKLLTVHFPALPASVVRLTGAGDCLVGGALASLCSGLDIFQSMAVGIAVAKAAVESETNVPSSFDLASIADDARKVYSAARVLFHQSRL